MDTSLARSLRSLLAAAALLLAAYGIASTPAAAAPSSLWQLSSLRQPMSQVEQGLGLRNVRQQTANPWVAHARPVVPAPARSTVVWLLVGLCFAGAIAWRRWPNA